MRRGWVIAVLLVGGVAHAGPKSRADQLFDDGRKYLAQKEYELACTAFEQSFAAEPAVGTQLNLAKCFGLGGKTGASYQAYLLAEQLALEAGDSKRAQIARKEIDRLAAVIVRLRVEIVGSHPDALYYLDDKGIEAAVFENDVFLDPGVHSVSVRVPGTPQNRVEFDGVPGETEKVRLEVPTSPAKKQSAGDEAGDKPLPEAPPDTSTRSGGRFYGGIALVAGGAALTGLGIYIALDARSDYRAACPEVSCDSPEAVTAANEAYDRAQNMTFVVLGGAALAVTGTYLILTSKRDKQPPVTAGPLVGNGTVGITLGGSL